MSYSYYDNMSSSEKDKLVDGNELEKLNKEHRKKLQSHFSPENVILTPKRRRYEDNDNEICEIENDSFQMVGKRNRKRTRPIINKDAQEAIDDITVQATSLGHQGHKQNEKRNTIGRSMVVFNSLSQNGRKINEQRRSDERNQNVIQKINNDNTQLQVHETDIHHTLKYNVTQHALQYAVNHQLPPFKIICQPEMKNHLEGTILIKALCEHIQNDFRKLNKSYNYPIGFDTWYIDKQGALICSTRRIELFVYVWDVSNYPSKLLNTTITPVPPVHLPPQHSIIFKGDLIDVLRRKPELLPQDVQLFIPVGFRNGGKNFISGQKEGSDTLPPQTHTSHFNGWPLLTRTLPTTTNEERREDIYENVLQEINMLRKDYDKLKLDLERREKDLIHKQQNYKTKLNAMLNLLALQNNQQNDCILKVYTVVNEVVPIIINSLKTLHMFMEKVVKHTSNIDVQNEYKNFQLIIEQNLVMLNDRNDLIIDHHRATTTLNEKATDIFRHGIEIMSTNEQ
ncbi:unnamed protein product [Rotaria sordida]|uniref:Uncharacterized protein n=1 Tax=Rotaria sordida TaxID=392033 RepID=A0A815JY17_9BILA|nr:unnamed protein product [Rotaria sordida]CAF1618285.1 unnamed protein product [Rotaria sordida]